MWWDNMIIWSTSNFDDMSLLQGVIYVFSVFFLNEWIGLLIHVYTEVFLSAAMVIERGEMQKRAPLS